MAVAFAPSTELFFTSEIICVFIVGQEGKSPKVFICQLRLIKDMFIGIEIIRIYQLWDEKKSCQKSSFTN